MIGEMMSDSQEVIAHAKIECFGFATDDVRLVLHGKYTMDEVRMHKDSAKFIVEAVAAANRAAAAPAAPVAAFQQECAEATKALAAPVAAPAPSEQDKIDAERWRFMMVVSDDEHGPAARAMEAAQDGKFDEDRPYSVQMAETVDAARAILAASGAA